MKRLRRHSITPMEAEVGISTGNGSAFLIRTWLRNRLMASVYESPKLLRIVSASAFRPASVRAWIIAVRAISIILPPNGWRNCILNDIQMKAGIVASCILKFEVENKYLEEIPRIRRVKIQKKSPRSLSAEEIGKVLAAARPEVRPMLQLLIFTGLRKGEVRHLKWSDVDLNNRLLHVRPKETWGPKTESSARTVPLCDPAVEALQMAWELAEKRK